ncbi:AAA family ATPase [Ktedonospora formicarum]|uniref:HTH iclR-type domain-containing protein n=1 Tax=Ktedonospora formicarum TaxID=2778364 RepID=A0A8J3MTP5_9CHLR|nr:AAA family ATPase [Ktedonospora formicarum]GHO48432.1 hypothetical protein KSX_65950 [Ktedonospora formicarum]
MSRENLQIFSRPSLPILTYKQFALEYLPSVQEQVWPIQNLLAPGLTLMTGDPHVGLNLLAFQLMMHVALGTHAFGRIDEFPTTQRVALYCALDQSMLRLQKLHSRYLDSHPGVDPSDVHCQLTNTWEALEPDTGLRRLEVWVTNNADAGLLVIDNLAQLRRRFKGSDSDLLDLLRRLAEQHNLCILLLHTCKPSSPLVAYADNHLHLKRLNIPSYYHLSMQGEQMQPTTHLLYCPPGAIQFQLAEREDTLAISVLNGHKALSRERLSILRLFHAYGDELTPADVARALGLSSVNTRQILHAMVMARMLRTTSYGRYTIDPFVEPLVPELLAHYHFPEPDPDPPPTIAPEESAANDIHPSQPGTTPPQGLWDSQAHMSSRPSAPRAHVQGNFKRRHNNKKQRRS